MLKGRHFFIYQKHTQNIWTFVTLFSHTLKVIDIWNALSRISNNYCRLFSRMHLIQHMLLRNIFVLLLELHIRRWYRNRGILTIDKSICFSCNWWILLNVSLSQLWWFLENLSLDSCVPHPINQLIKNQEL